MLPPCCRKCHYLGWRAAQQGFEGSVRRRPRRVHARRRRVVQQPGEVVRKVFRRFRVVGRRRQQRRRRRRDQLGVANADQLVCEPTY